MDDRSFIEHSLWGVLRPHFNIPVYDSRVFKWYNTFNGYVHIEELLKLRKANKSALDCIPGNVFVIISFVL